MAHKVVIVGGGFAGLNAAIGLEDADVEITLVDRTNHHLFQPLLYQVATGGLSPADIAAPIRWILRKQKNATVVLGEVLFIDTDSQEVVTEVERFKYDTLVLAAGALTHYFGNDDWEDRAHGLKTLADAVEVRAAVLHAFERAERESSQSLTFAVIGGGPTGVEMAGTIAEMSRHTLRNDFRKVDPARARVLLIEALDTILPAYPPKLQQSAIKQLERLGAEVMLGTKVTGIDDKQITVEREGIDHTLEVAAVVWAAGVKASPLGETLVVAGAELDKAGRVVVDKDLSIPARPEILVLGDMAHVPQDDEIVPGVAPAAIQMGEYAADLIKSRLEGGEPGPFRYSDKGSLATIGRSAAVADFGKVTFTGFVAWVMWLAIHIFFLIGFQNRILVLIQWAGNYISRNRSARLIVDYDD